MVRLNNRLDQWFAGLPPEVQQSPLSSGESSHFFLVLQYVPSPVSSFTILSRAFR